jgi:tetratricopeptide (TPR) repeat protein
MVVILFFVFLLAAYIGYSNFGYLRIILFDEAVLSDGMEVAAEPGARMEASVDAGSPEAVQIDSPTPQDNFVTHAPVDVSRLLKEGRYAEAVEAVRMALDADPGSKALEGTLARALNFKALGRYDDKDFAGAKELWEEARTLSDDPMIIKNLAFSQIALEDFSAAAETLAPLSADTEVGRTLKGLYLKLADLHYKSGEVGRSVEFFQKAYELDPTDARLGKTLKKLRAEDEAESGMERREGRHFVVKFDGAENPVAGHLIGLLLEEAYYKVGADLGFYPSDILEAVLYSGVRFHDITKSPSWSGAIYDGRIKIPAGGLTEETEALEQVIFHEYTHALVHRLSGGRAPTWLNEGLAQYEEGKSVAGYEDAIKGIVEEGGVELKRLEGSFMDLDRRGAEAAYLLSLSVTSYIIDEFGISSAKRILEELLRGVSLGEAISASVYLSYDDLERIWLESVVR